MGLWFHGATVGPCYSSALHKSDECTYSSEPLSSCNSDSPDWTAFLAWIALQIELKRWRTRRTTTIQKPVSIVPFSNTPYGPCTERVTIAHIGSKKTKMGKMKKRNVVFR